MDVLLIESHKSPVVSLQVWVKTGSVDEKKGQEGITHFIEHLLFKETDKFKLGEIATLIEGAGGQLNAYTSFDRTVFHITIASHYTQIAFEALSQMIVFPRFKPESIDDERQVVIEEIKRAKDSPHSQSADLLFSTLYPKHPYGHPILGYEENIKNFSPEQIIEYYQNHYFPENITLVISGDFQISQIKPSINKYFNFLKKHKSIQKSTHPFQKTKHFGIKKTSFQETHLHLAWRLSSFRDDLPALDAFSVMIGQGHSSRLYRKLRLQNLYVDSVSSYTYVLRDSGIFIISCELSEDKIDITLDNLAKELLSFFTEIPPVKELQKAITMIESDQYYEMETVDGLSEKYGFYEMLWNDPHYWKTYLNQLKHLKVEDLIHVVKKHLSPQNISLCVTTKKTSQEKLKNKLEEWVKHYEKEIFLPCYKTDTSELKKIPQKTEPDIKEVALPLGARMYLYKSSQTPTVSLDLGFEGGGNIVEPDALIGISELVRRSWLSGTSNYTESLLKERLDELASFLSAFCGKHTLGLSLVTLSSSLKKSLILLEDVLKSPLFLTEVIEREKIAMKKKLIKRRDSPSNMTIRSFKELIFKNHPYATDPLGTDQSLTLITQEDLLSYWRKVMNPQKMVVSIVGNFDFEEIKETFANLIESLSFSKSSDTSYPSLKPLTQGTSFFCEMKDKAQSSIVLGYRGFTFKSKNRFTLEVLEAILSGQSGRLFLELRDKASLAYTVTPFSLTGKEGGFFAIYIACQPDKGQLAIDMMKTEIQKLCTHLIPKDELERAKRYLIGHHNIALQKNSSLSSAIFFREIYNISYKEIFNYGNHIDAVTSEQILDLAQELFHQPEVIVTYGPSKPWS